MAGGQSWPVDQSAKQVFRSIDRRLSAQERRGSPKSPSDVLGPGMSARSIQILDWNSEVTTFNGFYWSITGALHAPDPAIPWTGQSIAKDDGSGLQQVWNLDPEYGITTWMRTWITNPDSGAVEYLDWQKFATPSGLIGTSELDQPVLDNIQDALDNAASAIVFAEQSNRVFRQDDEPTNPTDDYDLRQNDIWYDTDDGDRPYLWTGSEWVLLEQADAALAQAAADAAHAEAVSAAADAASAIAAASAAQTTADGAVASASGKAQVYYSASMPTGGSYNTNDIWFDTDDTNKMYLYNGSSWDAVQFGNAAIADLSITNAKIQDGTIQYAKIGSVDAGAITVGTLDGQRLTGTTVTGMTVQTTATVNRGIKFNSTGFTAYDSGGTATFALTAATGAVVMTGALLTGGTITGPTFKTTSTPSRGVQIDTTGIYGWDSSGGLKFSVSATTGLMTAVNGSFSGFIDSSVVTGGTVQTTSTAARGIKLTTAGLVGYDSGGNPTFVLDPTTGAVTMRGTLTAGSSITGATITGSSFQTAGSGDGSYVTLNSDLLSFKTSGGANIGQLWGIDAVTGMTIFGPPGTNNTAINLQRDVLGLQGAVATNLSLQVGTSLTVNGTSNLNGGVNTQGFLDNASLASGGGANSASGTMYCRVRDTDGRFFSSTAAPSSREIKSKIKDLKIDPRLVLQARPRTFVYKESPKYPRSGFIAEEFHDLGLTQWVGYEDHDNPEKPTGIDYTDFTSGLLLVDQYQEKRIDALEKRIKELEAGR